MTPMMQTKPRFGGWWIITGAALAVVGYMAGQQVMVLVYKVLQVTLGLLIAYTADRSLFHRALEINGDMPRDIFGAARLLARALVVLAVILGLTMGL